MSEKTAVFHLKKSEVKVYDRLCREADVDPAEYRSKRRVEAPPDHWLDLEAAYVGYGSRTVSAHSDESEDPLAGMFDAVTDFDDIAGDILSKFASGLDEIGERERMVELSRQGDHLDVDSIPD